MVPAEWTPAVGVHPWLQQEAQPQVSMMPLDFPGKNMRTTVMTVTVMMAIC